MAAQLLTTDTSLIVPLLFPWHALHEIAKKALHKIYRVPGHALVESFSVSTRFPVGPLSPDLAYKALTNSFPGEPLALSPQGYLQVIAKLGGANIAGGRIYDAIIAATALESNARLLTADRRALPIYALIGAQFDLIE